MSYSTKIFCFPADTTKPCIEIETNWWGARMFIDDPRFEACGPNSSYHDYEAYLTTSEMMELHEMFRPQADKYCESGAWKEKIAPKMNLLDDVLYLNSDMYSKFRVFIFEWESGY